MRIFSMAFLGLALSHTASALEVRESIFCASVNIDNECTIPIIRDQISLQDLSSGRIHFWTAVDTEKGDYYLHAWMTTDRPIPWVEPFHVHSLEAARRAGCAILDVVERTIELFLAVRYGNAEGFHNSQGVALCSDEESADYRTSSNLEAGEGTFSVEVLTFSDKVVPGGERKTLTVLP